MTSIDDDLSDFGGVAMAFTTACPAPTDAQISEWAARHPEHAEEIRDLARIMREDPEQDAPEDDAEADAMVARVVGAGMSRLDALRRPTLPDLVAQGGTSVPKVAAAIGIDRGVLADIIAGRLQPPIGPRLVAALASALGTAGRTVREAVSASFDAPLAGHASSAAPSAQQGRTYAQSIAASAMPEDRKAYWLADG